MDRPSRQLHSHAQAVASLATAAVLVAHLLVDVEPPAWARWAGAVGLALSLPLFGLPFVHLPRHGGRVPGGSYMETAGVARRGVYGVVRHPQYLGYMLLAAGFALLSPHPAVLGAAGVAVAGFAAQAAVEERWLLERFGEEYASYRARVPRFNLVAGLWRRARGA